MQRGRFIALSYERGDDNGATMSEVRESKNGVFAYAKEFAPHVAVPHIKKAGLRSLMNLSVVSYRKAQVLIISSRRT